MTKPAPARGVGQEEVIGLLRELLRRFRRQDALWADDHASPLPIDALTLSLLREVSVQPGVTVNELARRVGIPKSRVSIVTARLAGAGIIGKDNDPHDARLVRLTMTPDGLGQLTTWRVARRHLVQSMLAPLSVDELDSVMLGLQALLRVLPAGMGSDGSASC